jgi:membrane associated rhomboid family serine protease
MFEEPRVRRPRELPPVLTIAILALATIGSLLFWSRPQTVTFALADSEVWDGQVWRLVSAVFLHGSWWHLLFNAYWMWYFGRDVEAWMGPPAFVGFFVLTAAGASAAQFLAHGAGGIGLSGVVYALFGLLYALRRHKDFAAMHMRPQIVQLFITWFFVCIFLTYARIMAIANVAHGAGAVLGWLVGRAVLARRRVWALSAVGVGALLLVAATMYMPWRTDYVVHRMNQAIQRKDYAAALYWARKLEPKSGGDRRFQYFLRVLEWQAGEKGPPPAPSKEEERNPDDEGD